MVWFMKVGASLHRGLKMFFPVKCCIEQLKHYGDIIKYSDEHVLTAGTVNITVPLAVTNGGHYLTTRDAELVFLYYFFNNKLHYSKRGRVRQTRLCIQSMQPLAKHKKRLKGTA